MAFTLIGYRKKKKPNIRIKAVTTCANPAHPLTVFSRKLLWSGGIWHGCMQVSLHGRIGPEELHSLKGKRTLLTGQRWPGAASCNLHSCHLRSLCLGSSDTSGWTSVLSEQGQSHFEWPQSWPGWSRPCQRLSWNSRVVQQRRQGGWGRTALQGRYVLDRVLARPASLPLWLHALL